MLPWVQLVWDEFPGSLFPLPDWGSSPLFLQITFQFLTLPLLLLALYDSDVGMFKVVLEVPNPLSRIFIDFRERKGERKQTKTFWYMG